MDRTIVDVVGACATCSAHRQQQPSETLMSHPVLNLPFEKSVDDVCTLSIRDFLLVVDCFSKLPFVFEFHDKTSSANITSLKSLHSIHRLPDTLFADNMPFTSQQIQNFAATCGFGIDTSLPELAQSNGQVKRLYRQ